MSRVLRSSWLVQTWLARPPTVDEVRPERCVGCGLRHRDPGCRIRGHGLRARTILGPRAPGEAPEEVTVRARRYRCTGCRSVQLVVPREIAAGRRFSLSAMAGALASWALEGQVAGTVRASVSPHAARGFADPSLWPSLRRWVRERARLWPQVQVAARATERETAASLIAALCARLPLPPPSPSVAAAWEAAVLR